MKVRKIEDCHAVDPVPSPLGLIQVKNVLQSFSVGLVFQSACRCGRTLFRFDAAVLQIRETIIDGVSCLQLIITLTFLCD